MFVPDILKNYVREQKRKKAIEIRENAIERRKKALDNVTINDATAKGKTRKLEKTDPSFSSKYMENIKEYPQTPYDFLCIIVSMFSCGGLKEAIEGGVRFLSLCICHTLKKNHFGKKMTWSNTLSPSKIRLGVE